MTSTAPTQDVNPSHPNLANATLVSDLDQIVVGDNLAVILENGLDDSVETHQHKLHSGVVIGIGHTGRGDTGRSRRRVSLIVIDNGDHHVTIPINELPVPQVCIGAFTMSTYIGMSSD